MALSKIYVYHDNAEMAIGYLTSKPNNPTHDENGQEIPWTKSALNDFVESYQYHFVGDSFVGIVFPSQPTTVGKLEELGFTVLGSASSPIPLEDDHIEKIRNHAQLLGNNYNHHTNTSKSAWNEKDYPKSGDLMWHVAKKLYAATNNPWFKPDNS